MRKIIIDDNKSFANSIKSSDNDIIYTNNAFSYDYNANVIINGKSNLRELADDIIPKVIPDDVVLFININLKIGLDKRQESKGIELLIWLRIRGVIKHCVLYSFETLHALLNRQPKYLIATSKGTSFVQLPYNLININLTKLNEEEAKDENLKNCLKSAFSISQFRHRDANWWGVKQLWDVHQVATRGVFLEEYPSSLEDKFKELNNHIADFIYGMDTVHLKDYIYNFEYEIKSKLALLQKSLNELENKVARDNDQLSFLNDYLNIIDEKIKDLVENFRRYFSNTSKEFREINDDIDKQKSEKKETSGIIAELSNEQFRKIKDKEDLQQTIEEYRAKLSNIFAALNSDFFKENLPVIDREVRVLQIDDQAEQGWAEIFQYIIYRGILSPNFRYLVPSKSYVNEIGNFYEEKNEDNTLKKDCVKKVIEDFNPSLILLDFRLFDETNRSIDIENVSGKILLEKIRHDFKSIPVIMTSASNKIWTYEKLIKLGADGFWIKEGLDEQRTVSETVENYKRFLELVSITTSRKFATLKSFALDIRKIKMNQESFWWENHKWREDFKDVTGTIIIPGITHCNKENLFAILDELVILLRTYLHQTELKSVYNPFQGREWFYVSLILQHAGKLVELVHEFNKVHRNYNHVKTINSYEKYSRKDKLGGSIYYLRSQSSHMLDNVEINWDAMKDTIENIILWLRNTPKSSTVQDRIKFVNNKKNHMIHKKLTNTN